VAAVVGAAAVGEAAGVGGVVGGALELFVPQAEAKAPSASSEVESRILFIL
jgi:hypothetical protein